MPECAVLPQLLFSRAGQLFWGKGYDNRRQVMGTEGVHEASGEDRVGCGLQMCEV